jgi:hypothetical protein
MIYRSNGFISKYLDFIFSILIVSAFGVNIFIYLSPNKRYINAAYFLFAIMFDILFKSRFNDNSYNILFMIYVILDLGILIIIYIWINKLYKIFGEANSRIGNIQIIILGLIPLVLYSIFHFFIFDANQSGL